MRQGVKKELVNIPLSFTLLVHAHKQQFSIYHLWQYVSSLGEVFIPCDIEQNRRRKEGHVDIPLHFFLLVHAYEYPVSLYFTCVLPCANISLPQVRFSWPVTLYGVGEMFMRGK